MPAAVKADRLRGITASPYFIAGHSAAELIVMHSQLILLYAATWAVVALTPGPAVICSMAQATRHGFRTSLAGIAGIQTGNLLFFVSIAGGLASLLASATTAFTVLRYAGAIYLLYLGLRAIRSSFRHDRTAPDPSAVPPISREGLFLHGLLIQLTNPKALLFVSALLPQFIDPTRSAPGQLAILVVVTILIDTVVLSSYALFAARGSQSFRGSRWSAWLEQVFGAALVLFGVRLLVSRK